MKDEADVTFALKVKFGPPEFAFLSQVPDGTGNFKGRTLDGFAMELYPSRGLELHGFEIKCARSDWLRELKNPQKAEDGVKWLDKFWIAVSDKSIVQKDELPHNWGLLVPHADGLHIAVHAKRLHEENTLKDPMSRIFVASILRRVTEGMVAKSELQKEFNAAYKRGEEFARHEYERDADDWRGQYQRLKETVDDFEKISGVQIREWEGRRIGEAVRAVMTAKANRIPTDLATVQRHLEDMLEATKEMIKRFAEAERLQKQDTEAKLSEKETP